MFNSKVNMLSMKLSWTPE